MFSFRLQKSPSRIFGGKRGNIPDISKGISQSGMCRFESSKVSQAARPNGRLRRFVEKGSYLLAFL